MANSIKDLIQNPHPIYCKYVNYWNFLIDSYEGGVDYCMGDVKGQSKLDGGIINVTVEGKPLVDKRRTNLFAHKKERSEDFINRVDMSYYYNFCSPIIDIYTNHLFKESIISDWKNIDQQIAPRIDNIDRRGSSIYEFRREMAELAQVYGHAYVLTDKPASQESDISLAQQYEKGLFPYVTLFHPNDLINWAVDQFGSFYWVLLRESYNANVDPMNFDKDKTNLYNYRLWTRNEWVLFDESYEEVDRGSHNLGKVPLDIVYNKPSKKYKNCLGISEIADICFIARDVYNKCSELNEIIRNQTFAILCLQGKSTDYDEGSVGTSKALLYPNETNVPQYVSPQAENAKTLMDQIDRQVHKMFQLAKLDGGTAAQVSQVSNQSGVSKAFDFHETNSALAKKASYMEDAEMRIWNTYALWEKKQSFEGSISYSRDFNVQELNEDIDEAERLMRLQLGREFNINLKKEIIKKKFPRINDEEMNKMVVEMESKEGLTDGASLRNRLGIFNNNAIQGGKNGSLINGS